MGGHSASVELPDRDLLTRSWSLRLASSARMMLMYVLERVGVCVHETDCGGAGVVTYISV